MSVRVRLSLAVGLLAVLLVTVAAKLVEIQIVEHPRWLAAAERIQVRERVQSYPRGRIYDRSGLLLAFDVRAVSIALDNLHMAKPELLEELLQRYLGISPERARELVYRPKYFTWLARKVEPDLAKALKAEAEELGVRGLLFFNEWKRVYPQEGLASNLIGFAGLDNQGLEGLELEFDEWLRGREERREVVRGADGTVLDERVLDTGAPGLDLHLTLDARIQRIAERAIQKGVRDLRAKGGFAIVIDPRTGEVLAIAQDKTYDLNEFSRSTPDERKNLAVVQPFEPGSTFKPFAMLAALDAGAVRPDEAISGDDPVVIAGHALHNAEYIDYGPVTPVEIIQKSINTGMIRVAQRLGEESLYAFLKRLHIGEETGIELPGEVPGYLPPLERWSKLEIGAIPIGQGVAVTGVQLASRYAAIANGGRLRPPRIVAYTDPPEPTLESSRSNAPERIASAGTVQTLTQMMVRVVEEGTGVRARIEGFQIAGKSGTGQKAIPGRGYVKGKYTSLFAGFFPASDPQYVILVVLDEVGTRTFYGGITAAPIFKEIAEGIIELRHLTPATDKRARRR
jgi:cell division protein FtsI (penicillin-binding protein 3)/stage V sporulation protein D (sporulation-specific penicillin-binding protein)